MRFKKGSTYSIKKTLTKPIHQKTSLHVTPIQVTCSTKTLTINLLVKGSTIINSMGIC